MKFIAIIVLLIIALPSQAQDSNNEVVQLSGIIKDNYKKPLPFVNIVVPKRKKGTITDFWGYFSFATHTNDTIVFSCVGYKKQFFSVPDSTQKEDVFIEIVLEPDTVLLQEAVIFPWHTYEQFKQAFVKLDIPDDDIERAFRNFEMVKLQMQYDTETVYPSIAYGNLMSYYYERAYTKGQYPRMNILSPSAWAKFFEALQNGDFKQKH